MKVPNYKHWIPTSVEYKFFFGLIPIGCYRVSSYTNGGHRIYGTEKWKLSEIFKCYFRFSIA